MDYTCSSVQRRSCSYYFGGLKPAGTCYFGGLKPAATDTKYSTMNQEPAMPRTFYRANLPHIQPLGATFFVTFRLKNSLPKGVIETLRGAYEQTIKSLKDKPGYLELVRNERKRFFAKYDDWLDKTAEGEHYLKQPAAAQAVKEQLHRFDGELYNLIAYCIMSNHVHVLFDTSVQLKEAEDWDSPWQYVPLERIMKRVKGASSRYVNLALDKTGTLWQRESFDHYVRNEQEFHNIIFYILNNPVSAGLVQKWENYPNNFVVEAYRSGGF